jgi:hypothetical protein
MSRRTQPDVTALMLAMAAARLALHVPEARLDPLTAPLGEAPTLADALALADGSLLAAIARSEMPIARLARAARLSAFDLDLLGLAVLPALDDGAADVVEALARSRRLTAGRAARLLLPITHDGATLRRALRDTPLWHAGLLRGTDASLPAAERRLDPSPVLLAALDGALAEATAEGWLVRTLRPAAQPDESHSGMLAALQAWAGEASPPLLLLESSRAERAMEALAQAAGMMQRPAILLHPPPHAHGTTMPAPPWAEAGALAAAHGAIVALLADGDALPGPIHAPIAPVAVIGAETVAGRLVPRRHLRVPPPRLEEQRARWTVARPDLPAAEATALAAQSWMAAADIAAIAEVAAAPEPVALLAARMAVLPPRGARLATLREPMVAWDRLVLAPETATRLEDVVRRCRHRATVREAWGMDAGGSALVALLTGDPGTGKTLAAEAVARRLGLPLLAADLSRIVSKYIGETEKNLSELFALAEGFCALLFFDEADSLFGKRTAVQDAHDRYANIEVNYLLQRLERFDGIALLATNLAEGMDEAFLRRFDLTVPFRRPAARERAKLWQLHLPAERLAPGLDLDALAAGADVTGGEIRNAALTAAYAAAEAGVPIDAKLLRAALAQEFSKAGKPVPHALTQGFG